MNRLVIISGLSGSGKSRALHAFEDLGYYAIDNLPIKLFEKFIDLASGADEYDKVAMVMDGRDKDFVREYPQIFEHIRARLPYSEILFLEANDSTLLKRFSETRRKHPLTSGSVEEGVEEEKKQLKQLKDFATTVIDTSDMDVHELKKRIFKQFGHPSTSSMQIQLISFGFKHGAPTNCDLMLDVRFLSNPHFVPELRAQTGLDRRVQDFIEKDERAPEFLAKTEDFLGFLIPQYQAEGKRYLTIGIGCTGGKHRSVYMAEQLYKRLKEQLDEHTPIRVEHLHITV